MAVATGCLLSDGESWSGGGGGVVRPVASVFSGKGGSVGINAPVIISLSSVVNMCAWRRIETVWVCEGVGYKGGGVMQSQAQFLCEGSGCLRCVISI